jgi:hypothetical protein
VNTRNKNVQVGWKCYQNNPITRLQHEIWKNTDAFANGLAIIPGRVWHNDNKRGLYFISVDVDKAKGIREFCTINGKAIRLNQISKKFLVEQHKDNQDRAHISFYSPIPFPQKAPDTVLGLEVKGQGEHGLIFCSPSIHKDGKPYEIIGTKEPVVLSHAEAADLIQYINLTCIRNGIQYLAKYNRLNQLKPMIHTLTVDPRIRIPEGERHATLLSVADSLLLRYSNKRNMRGKT